MSDQIAAQALAEFAERYSGIHVESTGATPVNYAGILYNVDGSSGDPDIGGYTWKGLLQAYGINGPCYVTAPLPGGASTHPQFNVGGHMTTNADGSVQFGGYCYLMPLCSWHNSKARDEVPFQHALTSMLQLSGYMQGDLAATFLARMPGDAPVRIVGAEGKTLTLQATDSTTLSQAMAADVTESLPIILPEHYLVFRQVREPGRMRYVIEAASLP
ncbi:MAG: hypothetical protein QE484_16895 [Rhizobium sp.]|nr:hypothetical protein [Rhizobium sp.]